jgi:hypothetical protein
MSGSATAFAGKTRGTGIMSIIRASLEKYTNLVGYLKKVWIRAKMILGL